MPSRPNARGADVSTAAALPEAGAIIAGKYAIVRILGEGGMGIVYEATHLRLRQRVAIKMLLPEMREHEVVVNRFEREAHAAARLRGGHVARIMDVDVTPDGVPYMVMEFLEGHDLERELEIRGQFPYEEVVDYVLQVCSAMAEAHQLGIVHRDLKPSNLYLANDGGARVVKVLDFGISKLQSEGDAKLTGGDAVMGTAYYMSPEQVRCSSEVDARTDIWALGVILYELLTGRPPWIGTPTQVAAQIVVDDPPDLATQVALPAELASIVNRALSRRPEDRFPDVRSLAMALAVFAKPNTAGKLAVDALLSGGAGVGSFPRVSLPGPLGTDAPTVLQANAVSQPDASRAPAEGGTAPGWSQHSVPTHRRTALVGLVAAFGIGVVVLGAGAFAFMRLRHVGPDPVAAMPTSAPPPSIAASPMTSSAPSAIASTSASTVASSTPSRPPARPPTPGPRGKPSVGKPPPTSTKAEPRPEPSGNPLML